MVVKKMLEISDVAETDYIKTEAKTEKMLDLNKAAQKYFPTPKPAAQAQPQADQAPPAEDIAGFEDYLDEGTGAPLINPQQAGAKPAESSQPGSPAPIDDRPGFEDYIDE
jgi:hypothetical protein